MRFVVAVVGKPRDPNLAGAIREYETRAGRYWPIDVFEVRDEPARSGSADLVRERGSAGGASDDDARVW